MLLQMYMYVFVNDYVISFKYAKVKKEEIWRNRKTNNLNDTQCKAK